MIANYPSLAGKISELAGSPTFTCDERGLTGVRNFRVHGSVLQTFVLAMKGCPNLEQAPESYPGFPSLFCCSASGKPMPHVKGDPGKFTNGGKTPRNPMVMTSEWHAVECRFEHLLSFSYSYAYDQVLLPDKLQLTFQGSSASFAAEQAATIIPLTELQIVRKGIPQWIPKKIQDSIGKINNAPFSPIDVDRAWRMRVGLGSLPNPYTESQIKDAIVPAGCALFNGADAEERLDAAGRLSWDACYKFLLRPDYAPWNTSFRPDRATPAGSQAGRWEQPVLTTPTSSQLYEPFLKIPFGNIFS